MTIFGSDEFYLCGNQIDMIYLSGFHFPSAEQESKHFDMDYNPVSTTKWTDIPSVRTYDDFFEAHAGEFRKGR